MTDAPPPLEQLLADFRGEAQVLRSHGHKAQAETLERVCAAVAETMDAYLDWLTEDQAKTRSGRSVEFLRSRFPAWETAGLAKWTESRPCRRLYRRLIIPLRANAEAARAEAHRMAS